MNNREIHIWLDDAYSEKSCLKTYFATERAIEYDYDVIHTTQISFCSFRYNRRIFIHVNGNIHEIIVGDCDGTTREIKEFHNLEKMLISGEFNWC